MQKKTIIYSTLLSKGSLWYEAQQKYLYVEMTVYWQFSFHSDEESLRSWSVSSKPWNSWRLQCGTCMSNSYLIGFHFTEICFFMLSLWLWQMLTVHLCLFLFFFHKIYPHSFGAAGSNPAQVSTRTFYGINITNCSLLFIDFSFFSAAALFLPGFHQILHSSATRQTECGSRKWCFFSPPFQINRRYWDWKHFNYACRNMFDTINNLLEPNVLIFLCSCIFKLAVLPLWLLPAKGKHFKLWYIIRA